jgi:hypothetical protein
MNEALMKLDARLEDLAQRMAQRTSDPNERPTWLHWSDVEVLREARKMLDDQHQQIAHMRQAVSVALNAVMAAK